MPSTNSGPAQTVTPNIVAQSAPAGSASVPFDPNNVSIGGGVIGGYPIVDLSRYPATKKALANVRLGLANMNVLCIGDSTTVGFDGSSAANEVARSWVTRLGVLLTGQGLRAGSQNWFCNHYAQNVSSTLDVIDTRLTAYPAGWSTFDTGSIAGDIPKNSTNTNPVTWTPTVNTNTLDVYYFDVAGYDTITFNAGAAGVTPVSTVNGVSASTLTPAGGTGGRIKKVTVSTGTTAAANVWKVAKQNANGNNLIILGMHAYDSANPEIALLNMGGHSRRFSDYIDTSSYWKSLAAISTAGNALAGSPLAIINLGINDAVAGRSTAAVASDLQTTVAALVAQGTEVLFVKPVAIDPAVASAAAQATVAAAIQQVASQYGFAVLDLASATPFVSSNYGDLQVHPTNVYYQSIAGQMKYFFSLF